MIGILVNVNQSLELLLLIVLLVLHGMFFSCISVLAYQEHYVISIMSPLIPGVIEPVLDKCSSFLSSPIRYRFRITDYIWSIRVFLVFFLRDKTPK